MAVSGTDAYGAYLDTGIGTAVTVRPNVEAEAPHASNEVDTGSKIAPTSLASSHVSHRPAGSPR